MSDERLTVLEALYAWLERHVLEQDRAMAELGDELRRVRVDVETLRERLRMTDGTGDPAPPDESPPPHY